MKVWETSWVDFYFDTPLGHIQEYTMHRGKDGWQVASTSTLLTGTTRISFKREKGCFQRF